MASSAHIAHPPPSALARAALALALLLGFYALTLGIAACLFLLPIGSAFLAMHGGGFDFRLLLLFGMCWIAAGLLVMSLFDARRPKFVPPKRRLKRKEARELFAMIDELAIHAGTDPPHDVYLVPMPNLAVTEAGGLRKSRRVLILGAPLLRWLTVDELRSAIAHELGHFMGGDTRLTTFAVRTHALFESLVSTTQRDPFREGKGHYAVQGGFALAQSIAQGLVRTYGRLYLRVTMSTSRRQELAADALSASIVGGAIAARALEKVEVLAPMYMHYVNADVGHAVSLGAMPKDLTAAFDALRERKLAGDAGRALVDAAHRCVTGPFDSHPALGDRVRALASNGDPRREPDERIASLLFADPDALDAWLVDETRARVVAALSSNGRRVPTTRALAWSSIAGDVYVPEATQAARRAAERLHAQFPNATTVGAMFASVWRAAAQGKFVEVALRVHPALGRMPRQQGERAAVRVIDELLTILMRGAILERGGTMEPNLGEGAVALRLGDEHVVPAALLRRLSTDPAAGRAALDALATRLERVAD